jgi:hypothetical protein
MSEHPPSTPPARTEEQRRDDERYHDRLIEYVKHLTTLSTGSIVLEVAFLERFFPQPKWRALIVVSLVALATSVVASVIAHTALMTEPRKYTQARESTFVFSIAAMWAGFLVGIIALGIFGIRNIIAP